jgi:nitroreductase
LHNPTPTDHPIHELLRKRWSPRAFADRPLSAEGIRRLFEAARWAPSSYNEQPWSFVIADKSDQDAYDAIAACLLDANRVWAERAPLLGIAAARLTFARNDKPNLHAAYDLGQAMAHLTFQATAMDLYVHQMAGFDPEIARRNLRIPEEFQPLTAFAVGYLGRPNNLPNHLKEIELGTRRRKPLSDFLFFGRWGHPQV